VCSRQSTEWLRTGKCEWHRLAADFRSQASEPVCMHAGLATNVAPPRHRAIGLAGHVNNAATWSMETREQPGPDLAVLGVISGGGADVPASLLPGLEPRSVLRVDLPQPGQVPARQPVATAPALTCSSGTGKPGGRSPC
jgi:hypothetical protein